ncbi:MULTISPECIES: polysaccharide biosynthesis C-terminal domain-containing protein [unclassified Rhodanobacter]|uniref:lipopolysaccharide biosynthesis protein n=1 Tax=unclassified Rhodanobacter TaxID=2621553 RepID=UPI001BDE8BC0|nr:polysaccharide biosynthesis C-terminal domain-containing protein [Rhodanobacter sp. LX-99]MBT2147636.1 polysaccharide biosynthesis C-terminal domain-containing protein [Rhodanobacter sp. LX-100]
MLVLLTRLLGPRIYGSLAAVASLAVVLGLLPNLGAGFVMLARNTNDDSGTADVWRYAWPMTVLLGLFLLVAYVIAAGYITRPSLSMHILLALGASELLLTPFTMLLSFALQARERVPLSQAVQWLPLGLKIVATLPCFWFVDEQRLSAYATLQLFASMLGAGLGLWITRRYVKLDWRPRRATLHEFREGASYAAMNLVAANPSELDKIIAVRAIGTHDAGVYAATSRVMAAAVTPVFAMLLASQPRLFRHAREPTREGRRLIYLILILALAWGTVSGLMLTLCSPLLPWLFGESFIGTAKLMPWLAAVAPFLSLRLAAGTILVARGRPGERIGFELCGVFALVVGMLVLTPHFGIRGLAMALVIAELSMAVIGWWLVRHHLIRSAKTMWQNDD